MLVFRGIEITMPLDTFCRYISSSWKIIVIYPVEQFVTITSKQYNKIHFLILQFVSHK